MVNLLRKGLLESVLVLNFARIGKQKPQPPQKQVTLSIMFSEEGVCSLFILK